MVLLALHWSYQYTEIEDQGMAEKWPSPPRRTRDAGQNAPAVGRLSRPRRA